MAEALNLLLIGVSAGLALAIPVGPMALLLIDTTLRSGHKVGAAGALAMSTIDACYAVFVFVAGTSVASIVGRYGLLLSLGGATILLALGIQTIRKALKQSHEITDAQQNLAENRLTAPKTFLKFAAATVINPPTALYFLAIAPSLTGLTAGNAFLATLAFAGGVFLGSGVWQQALALAGLGIRNITTPRVRKTISLVGGSMIVALAISLALRATLA